MAKKTTMLDYLPMGPAPEKIPAGKILVHNQVTGLIRTRTMVGTNGFRAWWDDKVNKGNWQECRCGWRPDLGRHYRNA